MIVIDVIKIKLTAAAVNKFVKKSEIVRLSIDERSPHFRCSAKVKTLEECFCFALNSLILIFTKIRIEKLKIIRNMIGAFTFTGRSFGCKFAHIW